MPGSVNIEWIIVAGVLVVIAAVALFLFSRRKKALPPSREVPREPEAAVVKAAPAAPAPAVPTLYSQLDKTRGNLLSKLGSFFSKANGHGLEAAQWEELEEALLSGDVGVQTTMTLLGRVRERLAAQKEVSTGLKGLFVEEGVKLFSDVPSCLENLDAKPKPYVISIVGVNGVGKTTTIGKLTKFFTDNHKSVLLGAADTFRAAAMEQLKTWATRTGAQFVSGREGSDPGAVAFDSVTAGKARGVDVVIIDTAGRLHTKQNLMEELKKVHRVVKKVIPEAPHETWLVLDGTTGQNAIRQAKEFQTALELTGVIVTKLDGTAKGGAILSVAGELKLPVVFIGIGEQATDLVRFDASQFVGAILGVS